MTRIATALTALALAACGARDPQPGRRAPIVTPTARPHPGIDLAGPITVPVRRGPVSPRTPVAMLDLANDRVVVPVDVPIPPAGGAIAFSFGDDRAAWAAHIPDSIQIPALAYGEGRVYVSGGFEARTFYALDATTGHAEVGDDQILEDDGPTRAGLRRWARRVQHRELHAVRARRAKTGRRLWFRKIGDPTLAQTAVADGLVFASHPSEDGQALTAYRVRDGAPMWTSWIGRELLAAPVIAGDSVYASTTGGATFRFIRATGKHVWTAALGATTAPWIDGDELFVTRLKAGNEQQIVVTQRPPAR